MVCVQIRSHGFRHARSRSTSASPRRRLPFASLPLVARALYGVTTAPLSARSRWSHGLYMVSLPLHCPHAPSGRTGSIWCRFALSCSHTRSARTASATLASATLASAHAPSGRTRKRSLNLLWLYKQQICYKF